VNRHAVGGQVGNGRHGGVVGRWRVLAEGPVGSVVVVVGRVFVEYASQVLLADDGGPIEEFPA
jgi:hypothetical protein